MSINNENQNSADLTHGQEFHGISTVAILLYLVGLGPTSFQIFIPSIAQLQAEFQSQPTITNLTISLSMISFAVASLVYGIVGDRIGRRKVLLFGMLTLILGSIICAFGNTIEAVIFGRILQPAGGAAGVIVSRVIALDLFKGEKASNIMSKISASMMAAPLLGVPLGGWLTDHFGWRSNFYFILCAAIISFILVLFVLPETAKNRVNETKRQKFLLDYKELLKSRNFLSNTLQFGLSQSAFMTFMTAAPIILTRTHGFSVSQISITLLLVSVSSVAGNLISSKLPISISVHQRLIGGSLAGALASFIALGFSVMGDGSVVSILIPVMVFAFCNGVSGPAAQIGFMSAIPQLAGTAAGLSLFLSMQLASFSTQLTSMVNTGSPLVITSVLTLLTLLGFLAALSSVKVRAE